jgi:exosortase
VIFGIWTAVTILLFSKPVLALVHLALHDETSSHILLVPFITAWLLFSERKQAEPSEKFAFWPGIAFLIGAILIVLLALGCDSCLPKDRLALYSSSLVLFVIVGFAIIFGPQKARASSFSLAMLIFSIPIPDLVLSKIIYWLQSGSAAIAEVFFNISGAPVLREGFVFRLPKISIEVAQECSGIRSSLALLILALLVAHFSFQRVWKKVIFVFAGLCMMLIKNGIRIAALTLLANYVNPNFLYGNLHHQGGIVFFIIGLALLFPVFWFLRRGEVHSAAFPSG